MALKPELKKPNEKDILRKLDDIAKHSYTDLYGMGIMLKDTYRMLTDKEITNALVTWKKLQDSKNKKNG